VTDRRADLLQALLALGATAEEIGAAERENRLALLAYELTLWPDRERLTVAEAAARSGMSEDIVRAALLRLGLPDPGDEAALATRSVDALGVLRGGMEVFGADLMLQFTRVVGAACASIAEAAVAVFGTSVAEGRLPDDADVYDYAATVLTTTTAFATVGTAVDVVLRQHFEAAITRLEPRTAGREARFAIGFVDLVGSTAASQHVDTADLARALASFDDLVADLAGAHGVRLVKLLGDGAMLAARDVQRVVDVCRSLLMSVPDGTKFEGAHAGVAYGPVVAREGDYFGLPVNLAARAAAAADAGTILVDAAAAAHLGEAVEPAGEYLLKGISGPVELFRVR